MSWFIHLQSAQGVVTTIPDGTVNLPGLAFSSETNTGIYRPAAGTIGFAVLGVEVARFNAGGETLNKGNGLTLSGSVSGTFTQKAASATTSYTVFWPPAVGAAGAVLSTDTSGNLSWVTILPVANGGTNSNAVLNNNRLIVSVSGAMVEAGAITAARALISDANGIPTQSAVTSTELGYSSGVTSAIQTQLNGKQATGSYITALTGPITATGPGSVATSVSNNSLTNTMLAQMPAYTVKGNNTGAAANASDLTLTQARALFNFAPHSTRITSGSGTYSVPYYFLITSGSATLGATYTNNSQTFTVVNTVSSATILFCTSTGAPAASGTLTKASGTGDATITFSLAIPPLWLLVEMVGSGAGGAGNGSGATSGGAGASTTFGSSLLTCTGGLQNVSGAGGLGGTPTINAPAFPVVASVGGPGGFATAAVNETGGSGGVIFYGGNGQSGIGVTPTTAVANSGAGGAGGASTGVAAGPGGGAAGGLRAMIPITSTFTFAYGVGAGQAGGSAGTSGQPGGASGSGQIGIVEGWQ